MKPEPTQEQVNAMAELKRMELESHIKFVYLKKDDGTIVMKYYDGTEAPIPVMEDYDD